jgi:mRNA-degrading endonuclease RelE of RelBE toxin-antitoxin system
MPPSDPSKYQTNYEIEIIREAEKEILSLKKMTFAEFVGFLDIWLLKPTLSYSESRISESVEEYHGLDYRIEKSIPYHVKSKDLQKDHDLYIKMSSEFIKNLDHLKDTNFQGRVLKAITKLLDNPINTKGDTVKKLSGEFEGKWRYRIGDFRLIYMPDQLSHTIILLAIRPRGTAYE